eukprot:TRINITY_DN3341_c0_g1_i1.p1 TRINITY_DN3341_c0_g1~~TRINITY_DN3341_c0_g1_i1.p1  ORF type:complete len:533 (+),score=72.54 TRINITY_DN3341_c0_g1_i1:516-2114(+)
MDRIWRSFFKKQDLESLGPLSIFTVFSQGSSLPLPVAEFTVDFGVERYTVKKANIPLTNVAEGPISEISRVNFTRNEKREANIPADAEYFCWAYPSVAFFSSTGKDALSSFLKIGGFVYFDKEKKVVAVNGVKVGLGLKGAGLCFCEPRELPPEAVEDLIHQFVPVTAPDLLEAGAVSFMWMRPLLEERIPSLAATGGVPFGGFAYLLKDGTRGGPKFGRYFAVKSIAHTILPVRPVVAVADGVTAHLQEYLNLVGDAKCAKDAGTPFTAHDALIIVDAQRDFLAEGRAPVLESETAAAVIAGLIVAAQEAGSLIIASRAYYSAVHSAFCEQPDEVTPQLDEHCIQGDIGSHFIPSVSSALHEAMMGQPNRTVVTFKGFHDDFLSLAAFASPDEPGAYKGSVALKCSNQSTDPNAPPDVLALHHYINSCTTASSIAENKLRADVILRNADSRRVFICGLPLDLSVIKTAVAARKIFPDRRVFIVIDATRPLYRPGIGSFGSGFVTRPKDVVDFLQTSEVLLALSSFCIPPLA